MHAQTLAAPARNVPTNGNEWLTQAECCADAKISKSQFFCWKNTLSGFPRAYRIGARAVRYKRSEWQAFLERNAAAAA